MLLYRLLESYAVRGALCVATQTIYVNHKVSSLLRTKLNTLADVLDQMREGADADTKRVTMWLHHVVVQAFRFLGQVETNADEIPNFLAHTSTLFGAVHNCRWDALVTEPYTLASIATPFEIGYVI